MCKAWTIEFDLITHQNLQPTPLTTIGASTQKNDFIPIHPNPNPVQPK